MTDQVASFFSEITGLNSEEQRLQQFAMLVQRKVLASQVDLDPRDKVLEAMLDWCRQQSTVVVLQSGAILSADPASRLVQNCKIVMQNKGLTPGLVHPATSVLIRTLLDNAITRPSIGESSQQTIPAHHVSSQQQRLRMLVKGALDVGATDIHMEVRADVARIRLRKQGELFLHTEWLPRLAREVVSVAFNKETDQANSHFNPLMPQSASMPLTIEGEDVRLRLASLPAHQGFDVVMRILTTTEQRIVDLAELGYTPSQVQLLQRALKMPAGAIILAGPTGSGKTTTLATCMKMAGQNRKVYSIEDPVEKVVNSITQVPVNTEHYDRSFASMARTVLRMDPDVLVLGETRDEDTAAVMARAAITGHLVFSTVHASSATGIVTRLNDLGVSFILLSSPDLLTALVCQRLVPLLCPACKVPLTHLSTHPADFARWQTLFQESISTMFVRGHDTCTSCQSLGVNRRTVVAEMIWIDAISRDFIRAGDMMGWQQYLHSSGWRNYHQQLLQLVQAGECDPLDAEKLSGEFNHYSVMSPETVK